MSQPICLTVVLALGLTAYVFGADATASGDSVAGLPGDWGKAWTAPGAERRPLQIVHGVRPEEATPEAMKAFRKAGLGGIVCNVAFAEYMTSEKHWQTLVSAVDACRKAGLVVWIYDEDGYPSGAAGGLVLKTDPAFENVVLTYDPSKPDPFALRRAYEHTHASNNYYAARRYPNLIDNAAMQCFVEKTHDAYWRHLKPHFGTTIRAFFTDEPSLMAVNLGPLSENVRRNVRVVDPIDTRVAPLPSVPWCNDLPDVYRQRYAEDLMPLRRSLFVGDSPADRQTRRRFWAMIADLITERYYGRIQEWCRAHNVASSGHNLWEEEILHHVPLYGNGLKALSRMDIPGMDMLSSDPMTVVHGGWMTAALPLSAALFNGGRRVMTEISDFVQRQAGKAPAPVEEMQAAAAWQAALGVTEFTSYYGSMGRIVTAVEADKNGTEQPRSKAYGGFVGRLNAILREAIPNPNVLLYYPIYDLWAEYLPVAQPLKLESQSKRAQQIVRSFRGLGHRLLTSQIGFCLVDHELLSTAEVKDGRVRIKGHSFDAIVLPSGVELPEPAAGIVKQLAAAGRVMQDGTAENPVDLGRLRGFHPTGHITPPCDHVIVGRFVRDGREILLTVNVGRTPYEGQLNVDGASDGWLMAHPDTGRIEPSPAGATGKVPISLPTNRTLLLVGPTRPTGQ